MVNKDGLLAGIVIPVSMSYGREDVGSVWANSLGRRVIARVRKIAIKRERERRFFLNT